ncbi:MAG: hypothetical protein JSV09_13995 [Thermoplasmata archaeon]|nr:MAG: hypothetical protein JSV09_13995 [Thermoplasmata archaeon]
MINDSRDKSNGLVRKMGTFMLTLVMVLSVFVGMINFVPVEVEALQTDVDAYGYYFVDSKEPDPVETYSWIDGVTGGTATGLGDDANSGFIALGFSFFYYDTFYTDVTICSNGWVSFIDDLNTDSVPDQIPDVSDPAGVIAPFWTDLDPSYPGAEVYYKFDVDKFIVTWWDVPIKGTAELQRFEVVLFDSGEILFQYMDLDMPLPTDPPFPWPGVGIESSFGDIGLGYNDVLEDNLAIRYYIFPPAFPDDLAVIGTDLTPTNVEQGEQDIPILGLTLTADNNAIGVSSINIALTGTATDTDITVAKLWHDKNNNGIPEAIIDEIIAQSPFALGQAGLSIPFVTGQTLLVRVGIPQNVIITYDISPMAPIGATCGAQVISIILAPDFDTVSGLPVSSLTSSIAGPTPDTLTVSSSSLQSASAPFGQGQAMIPMALLTCTASSDRADIFAIMVELSASANIKFFNAYARLFHDVDDDGQFDATIDVQLGDGPFSSTPPYTAALFPKGVTSYFRVNAGTNEQLIIAYDIEYLANPGVTADVYLESTSVLAPMDTVSASGFPFTSNQVQITAFTQPSMISSFTYNPPTIDGRYHSGEWADATTTDLINLRGNGIQTICQVMNDNFTLYMVLDAVGDTTRNPTDVSSIGFDTNHDEVATTGEEDQFVIGGWLPNQTAHYVFDTPSTGWVVEDSPFSHVNLAGAWGFNSTDNLGMWHRFYEYQIPLSLLGVPTPVPPGYTVGFTVGRHDNVTDTYFPGSHDPTPIGTSNQTYWPMYYASAITDLSMMGNLILSSYNTPPLLEWTGEVGYITDGVSPDSGTQSTPFVYRVKYSDFNNHPPASGYPKLYIQKPCGINWELSPFTMNVDDWVGTEGDYTAGRLYTYTKKLSPAGTDYAYFFNATDGMHWATGDPTFECTDGPDVTFTNTPPVLEWTGEAGWETDGVNPDSGIPGTTTFEYKIKYSDIDDEAPVAGYPKVFIEKPCGVPWTASPFEMTRVAWVGGPNDYVAGAIYSYPTTLTPWGDDYGYYFNATDGSDWATEAPTIPCTSGPVVNTPPVLDWTGQPGYVSDGIDPDTGNTSTVFEYRIKYSDADNNTPESGYPLVYIEKPCGVPYPGSPYTMNFLSWVGAEFDYVAGAIYNRLYNFLNPATDYAYYFNVTDGIEWATGPPTVPCLDGPVVNPLNTPPVLEWTNEPGYGGDGVHPDFGTTADYFEYRINYSDADNDPPASGYPELHIDKPCGEAWGALPFEMEEKDPADTNYVDGKIYYFITQLVPAGSDYAYYFLAKDVNDALATGDPTIPCANGPLVDPASVLDGPPNLEVHRNPPHVDLNWDAVTGADSYRVYTSTDRFLDFASWTLLASPTGTNYQHLNGMSSQTQYYVIRGFNDTEGLGNPSGMGTLAYASFATGGNPSVQIWFSLPYRSMYTKASHITDELTSSSITVLGKWDNDKQKSIVYTYFRGRWRGPDFDINAGDALWVRTISDFNWYINGTDKDVTLNFIYKSAKRNINWISLPYSGYYANAHELVAAIEGGDGIGFGSPSTKISAVVKWDAATQSEIRYDYDGGTGWGGVDFSIGPMDGIYIEVIADFSWPPEMVTPPLPP